MADPVMVNLENPGFLESIFMKPFWPKFTDKAYFGQI
jgi:hypothetical protein